MDSLENKKIIAIMGLLFSFIIITMTMIAVVVNGNPLSADNNAASSGSTPPTLTDTSFESGELEEEDEPEVEVVVPEVLPLTFNKPSVMRAVTISPGVEYLTGSDKSQATVQTQIISAMNKAKELDMNTVILTVGNENGVAYPSGWYPQLATAFDPLEYAISTARSNGLFVYLVYDLCKDVVDGKIAKAENININFLDDVMCELEAFAKDYKADGILFTNYTNPYADTSY